MKQRLKPGQDEVTIITARRSKQRSDQGSSGAWKVAFADFTLAMMALFMVLWVVEALKSEREAEEADAMHPMVGNPVWEGGAGIFEGESPLLIEAISSPPAAPMSNDEYAHVIDAQHAEMAELAELAELMRDLAVEVGAQSNLQVEVVPQGLRILIKDDQNRFMFQRGSAVLTTHFKHLLERLSAVLGRVDNKLIISGHTDATPYPGSAGYNNWNLSGDRALSARNLLVQAGLPARNILQVTAQADGMLLLPDDPKSGANRRIEVLMLTTRAEALYHELFSEGSEQVHISEQGADYRAASESEQAP